MQMNTKLIRLITFVQLSNVYLDGSGLFQDGDSWMNQAFSRVVAEHLEAVENAAAKDLDLVLDWLLYIGSPSNSEFIFWDECLVENYGYQF